MQSFGGLSVVVVVVRSLESSWLQELTIIGEMSSGVYPFDSVLLLSKLLVDMGDVHLSRRLYEPFS